MTIWRPRLAASPAPLYRRIADQLAHDVAGGVLVAGSRLPTQRALATALGVTVVTVTRAYREAADRGLIESAAGRGSFVRKPLATPAIAERDIDLATNVVHDDPPPLPRELAARLDAALTISYGAGAGTERHRAAGARWIARTLKSADPSRIVVTTGAQQAMFLAIAALTRPGDTILAEEVAYHGIRTIASLLHLKLKPLALDRYGILPDALEHACRPRGPRLAYLTPTLQNPTGSVMPEKRRRDVAAIANRHGLTIIEDDVYGAFAHDPPPPLTSHLERGIFLTGLGKSVSAALRIGYLFAPADLMPRITTALNATSLFTSPLAAELATTWIEDGTAAKVVARKRELIATRQQIARRTIERAGGDPASPHVWLPTTIAPDAFAAACVRRAVRVAPASLFATGSRVPNAVRLSLGAPADNIELEVALRIVADVAQTKETITEAVV